MINCKYCKTGVNTNLDYKSNWTSLYMECYLDHSQIVAYGDDEAKVDINFCPFCGRQLNPEYIREKE